MAFAPRRTFPLAAVSVLLAGLLLGAGKPEPVAPTGGLRPSLPRIVGPAAGPGDGAIRMASPGCTGEYADFLTELLAANAAFEKSPEAAYSYCLRTVAVYEHPYFGRGGKLRRTYLKVQSHGTGFAFRQKEGETYLATNEHVTTYPEVTDDEHKVEGVPAGSRKVKETVRIVANESDEYEPAQIPLTPVLSDAALDIAVLKTRKPLRMVPYRLGRSSSLRGGNVIVSRGYPLGVFPASNSGKVSNTFQEDHEGAWNHADFVTDAALNSGNSGSPVFAVSCRTGELELVGLFHAHYSGGTGLGLVIGIDQLREVFENLRLPTRDEKAFQATLVDDRKAGLTSLVTRHAGGPAFFPFGDRTVRAEQLEPGVVRFSLFRDFPLFEAVQLALVDRGGMLALDVPGKTAGPVSLASLDPQLQEPTERLAEGLWRTFRLVEEMRSQEARLAGRLEGTQRIGEAKSRLNVRLQEQRELLGTLDFEAEELTWPVLTPDSGPIPQPVQGRPSKPDGGAKPRDSKSSDGGIPDGG